MAYRPTLGKRSLSTVISLAAMAGTILAAPPATGAPPTPDGQLKQVDIPEPARKQVPLTKAAGMVRDEIARGNYTGYAGIELEDAQVAVWWKGEVPEQVHRAINEARSTAPIRVGAAAYSLRELQSAGDTVRTALKSSEPRVKYAVDGSRIVVTVNTQASARPLAIPPVGVPVELVEAGPKVPLSRVDDWAPWNGGADMIMPDGGRCTTGFPVRNAANERFLLTAGHCGTNGDTINDGSGEYIGWFTAKNEQHDLGLVVASGGVNNRIYVGGLDKGGSVRVDGWDEVFAGEYLCQSGGSTARETGGPVCNLRVERFNGAPGDKVEARQIDGAPGARKGDSGGPVYTASASGGVIAKGINCYIYGNDPAVLGFATFGTAARDYGIWIAQ